MGMRYEELEEKWEDFERTFNPDDPDDVRLLYNHLIDKYGDADEDDPERMAEEFVRDQRGSASVPEVHGEHDQQR